MMRTTYILRNCPKKKESTKTYILELRKIRGTQNYSLIIVISREHVPLNEERRTKVLRENTKAESHIT